MNEDAQELTDELLDWEQGKDSIVVVPALLVAAAKVGAAEGHDLKQMLKLLTIVFEEECEKHRLDS